MRRAIGEIAAFVTSNNARLCAIDLTRTTFE